MLLLAACLLGVIGWIFLRAGDPARVATDGDSPAAERERPAGRTAMRERAGAETATARIFGTVSAAGGGPIRGAMVCALPVVRGGSHHDLPTCARTNDGGTYEITGSVGAAVRLHASASGFRPGRYVDPASGESTVSFGAMASKGRNLVLERGGVPVRGVVRDAAGGEIQGALVTVGPARPWDSLEVHSGVGGFSDGDGAFEVWSEPGDVVVRATAEGYAPASRRGVAPGFVEITLTPESVIAGRVVLAGTDEGVADVMVEVGAIGTELSGVPTRARTDAGGRFRFAQLTPGRYKPHAKTDHLQGEARESVLLGVGETSDDVVIELHDAPMVEGRVLFADAKRGCASGGVTLGDELDSTLGEELDASGRVRFPAVPPGDYAVSVYCADGIASLSYPVVSVRAQDVTGLEWFVEPGGSIAGRVESSAGEPVAGWQVHIDPASPPGTGRITSGNVLTGEDGAFELGGLLPGDYRVSARGDGYVPPEPSAIHLDAGDHVADVVLSLGGGATVRGTVTDASGTAIPSADVTLVASGSTARRATVTTEKGEFEFRGVEPGQARLRACHRVGCSDDEAGWVEVDVVAGRATTVTLAVSAAAGTITGTVIDDGGAALADVFVDARLEGAPGSGAGTPPVMTDGDGTFSLSELPPGRYTVRAMRRGGGEATAHDVAVGDDVELRIIATGSISGRVELASGDPATRFSVSISGRPPAQARTETFTSADGSWRLEDVVPDTYTVRAKAIAGDATKEGVVVPSGAPADPLVLVLEGRASLEGRIVDATTGDPIADVAVLAAPSGTARPPWVLSTFEGGPHISDHAGAFRLDDVPTGSIIVWAIPRDWESATHAPARLRARTAAGSVTRLPALRLARRRIAHGRPPGDLGFTVDPSEPGAESELDAVVVASVRSRGPAHAAGLRVGDSIIAVDGTDVTGDGMHLFYELTRIDVGTLVRLTLASGAEVSITAVGPR